MAVCCVCWKQETRDAVCSPVPSNKGRGGVSHVDCKRPVDQTLPSAFDSFRLFKTPVKEMLVPASVCRALGLGEFQ